MPVNARVSMRRQIFFILVVVGLQTPSARFQTYLKRRTPFPARANRCRDHASMADSRIRQCLGIPDGYERECLLRRFGGHGIKKAAQSGLQCSTPDPTSAVPIQSLQ